jgi:hypothetical protein
MTCFRIAVVALLVALSGSIQAADAPVDAEKLRGEVARLTAANAELNKKVQELTLAKQSCLQVLDQIARANKDD